MKFDAIYYPDPTQRKISQGVRAAFFWSVLGTLGALVLFIGELRSSAMTLTEDSVVAFLTFVLLAGLTLGIYFKSRICAVLMLLNSIGNVLMILLSSDPRDRISFGSLLFQFFILFCFYRGVRGTFAFHMLKKTEATQAVPPPLP